MNDSKLFWTGLAGGIVTILAHLTLIITAYIAVTSMLGGDWRPVIITLPFSALLYLIGAMLETLSEMSTKINQLEEKVTKITNQTHSN